MGRYERRRRRNRRVAILLVLLILVIIVAGTILVKVLKGDGLPSFNFGKSEDKEEAIINPYVWDISSDSTEEETPSLTAEEKEALEAAIQETTSKIDSLISNMSLREKILQLHVIAPETITPVDYVTAAGDATKTALQEYPVGGFCYDEKNFQDEDQTKEMFTNLQQIPKIKLLTVIEEEGGDNAPLMNSIGTEKLKNMFEYWSEGASAAEANAKTIGSQLKSFGLNTDLAPVANILTSDETTIGKRAYSDDYQQGAEFVAAAVKGFHEGGVACTLKYFPTFGYSTKTLEELKEAELLPFTSGIRAGADMVMVGENIASEVDSEPAMISEKIIGEVLRTDMGFTGVVITDALDTESITSKYSQGDISVKAIKAGVDIIYRPASLDESIEGITSAVESGEISEERIDESLRRILTLKAKLGLI